jgi:putative ABC transport system ATP-binding protein/lipoprotein-releasing system ATP-binding protein
MNIVAKNIGKEVGDPPTRILSNINLEIKSGEFVALTGRSGSGKSSLLYLLSSIDIASEGTIELEGLNIKKIKKKDLYRFRNEKMGFIFQFHYLISELSALENVLLPTRKFGYERQKKFYAEHLLEQVGLGDKFMRLPRQLSGGEQQRVAVARSLVMEPQYIFADEPTGSLDSINGDMVMNIIRDANEKRKTTVILVTHDPDFAHEAKRQVHLADGRIV